MSLLARIPFDKKQIELAIEQLEGQTSAELRVYIEWKMPKSARQLAVTERAQQIFTELAMHTTRARNGVLIYVAFKDHCCAIIGDSGIHQYVGNSFWQQQNDLMIEHFKQGNYTAGLVGIIKNIGNMLAQYFPIQADDENELANEVIIHE